MPMFAQPLSSTRLNTQHGCWFAKVDTEAEQALGGFMQIRSIPTLAFSADVKWTVCQALSRPQLQAWLARHGV